ncbi:uncharacterized protein LOC126842151 [Adelges cooleyi]|uniref:uncharacterized protein LOC126842151 n=1 Tax=Adelges cooleyi TaxID=133065 RepID=UPI00217FD648|nr:uncharacterized protein LOC126842151 [Adelges cooleyi]
MFSCDQCEKVYTSVKNVVRHKKAVHYVSAAGPSSSANKRPITTINASTSSSNNDNSKKSKRMKISRLRSISEVGDELASTLRNCVLESPIKFNLKLEATYNIPHQENSEENRSFKTGAKEIFQDTNIEDEIDNAFRTLLTEEEEYTGRGFNFIPKLHKPHGREALLQHKKICGEYKPVLPIMPEEGTKLKFEAWQKTQKVPFAIYADFESLLVKSDKTIGANTEVLHEHVAMSYAFIVKVSDEVPQELLDMYNIRRSIVLHRGSRLSEPDEVAKRFVADISEEAMKISELLKNTNVPLIMSEQEVAAHTANTACEFCKTQYSENNLKTADHDHLTGKFRRTLCNKCNLKLVTTKYVPCFMHNMSGYDAHYIIRQLGNDSKRITVIPNTEEKYISFSKFVTNTFSVRFVDTFRFMAASLASLSDNLRTSNIGLFHETAKEFAGFDINLVTRKGVYPYSYTSDWDKLEERKLPDKKEFFNDLSESHISQEDYDHALKVWKQFRCQTLGEYSDVYLKIDTLMLCDVFEAFRNLCMHTYNLDAAHYFTSPGLSFDAMLLCTGVSLELLSDYEMNLMFERGIRGGLTQSTLKYAKANNPKAPNYDPKLPDTWIMYQDVNNLYGWALSQFMPFGGFKWVTEDPNETLQRLDGMDEHSSTGLVFEVDISYPESLHDAHNELPFLPETKCPPNSRVKKLLTTFEKKENYVVHYLNLKQAIANGLRVEKVHRVLEFQQSAWLSVYIELNTKLRQGAANDFEKDFFKLMNNSVFGK